LQLASEISICEMHGVDGHVTVYSQQCYLWYVVYKYNIPEITLVGSSVTFYQNWPTQQSHVIFATAQLLV